MAWFVVVGAGSVGLTGPASGQSWSATEAPLPQNAAGDPGTILSSVACESAGSCYAVGSYYSSSDDEDVVLETLSGGIWSATEAPLPSNADTDPDVWLGAVACGATGPCEAVGYYHDSAGNEEGLLESYSDGSWSASEAPLPSNAGEYPALYLDAVACGSAGACEAVGNYIDSAGDEVGLIETLSGQTWSATEAPLPSTAGTEPYAALTAVACGSEGSCDAVGSYDDSSGNQQGFLETLSGGAWSVTEAPLPSDAGTDPEVSYNSTACGSVGSCEAVGSYHDSSGIQEGLLETLSSGASWSALEAPLPAGVSTSTSVALESVVCESASSCEAVGSLDDTEGVIVALGVVAPTISKFSPTSGRPGTRVTITGTNLSGATSVTIGGATATVTSDTSTKIKVKVPRSAKTGKIDVVTAGGKAVSKKKFKVT